MSCIGNIRVEPCNVSWGDVDLGKIDGDIEVTLEEQTVDITTHQDGTNVLDGIRTGKKLELTTTLKEFHSAQFQRIIGAGGAASTAVAEVSTITCIADVSGSLNNKYFLINTADNAIKYYVWLNVNSAGVDPAPAGYTEVEVALATSATATAVASAIQSALDALAGFVATSSGAVVTVTNAATGNTTDLSDFNTGFTLAVTTQGQDAGVYGWGTSKDFTAIGLQAAKLVLHPVVLTATDMTRDLAFWKAYPMPESIVFSGENPQTVSVTWKILPDCDRQDAIKYFVRGNHL